MYPASVIDANFELNQTLKEIILKQDLCRSVTIAELKMMDASNITEKFTINSLGPGELEELVTQYGARKIKRDIYAQDASVGMQMQMFEKKLEKVSDKLSYEITHIVLRQYGQSEPFLQLTGSSIIKEIPSLKGLTSNDQLEIFQTVSSFIIVKLWERTCCN